MAVQKATLAGVPTWDSHTNFVSNDSEIQEATLTIDTEEQDATVFDSSNGVYASLKALGVYTWSVDMDWLLSPAAFGTTGGIANFSNGYAANVTGWDMTITWQQRDITVQTSNFSAVAARSFCPLRYDWSGTYTCLVDDTTALVLPGPGTSTASVDFNIIENGTTDWKLEGTVLAKQLNSTVEPGGVTEVTFGYTGSGQLTFTGDGGTYTEPWWTSASTIGAPVDADTITLKFGEVTGPLSRTVAGEAFLSSWNIRCNPGELIGGSMTAQGVGALTPTWAS